MGMTATNGTQILRRIGDARRVLLLQGPLGPFFSHLGRFLQDQGRTVSKINFNAGDRWFYRAGEAFDYTDTPARWEGFIRRFLEVERIDALLLFGDCRWYHRRAIECARELGVAVFVFEEGYVRPGRVTLERDGVNGHSILFRRLGEDAESPGAAATPDAPPASRSSFGRMARYAATYYLVATLGKRRFPHYRHHKNLAVLPEAIYWLRSGWRKLLYRYTDRSVVERLEGELRKRYFLVPLQVFNDSQIKAHSDFRSVRAVIAYVLDSFARHAPDDAHLVFKHHPMDRGHRHYGRQIAESAAEAGIGGRVHYVHDLHLPTLLKGARGVVVVNSTTGLSAMFHGAPVKALGRAIYDMPGLTHQGALDGFWLGPVPPDAELHRKFRAQLIARTQVIGAFYSGRPLFEEQGEAASAGGAQITDPRPAPAGAVRQRVEDAR